MTTHLTQLLERAICTLVDEGKKPTVALIKTRLNQAVPIPLVIHALQQWKSAGYVTKSPIIETQNEPLARIQALEQEVLSLKERIARLEKQHH